MNTIGFPISHKKNENRRAILPEELMNFRYPEKLFIERGYGEVLHIDNSEYESLGCRICSREEALAQSIICDPKIGDADYLDELSCQIIFGWIHAVQNKSITDTIIQRKLTGIAWEDMYYKGRHIFWRNNEIAGEAAIMHAFLLHGIFPYETKVAIIGKGNISRGAQRVLTSLGADIMVYDRHTESLIGEELTKYDVIVNALLWDTKRKDHIIYKEDLKKIKKGALIIDISCDRNGAIETCIPTSFDNPTYIVDSVKHYAVDHTPSLFYKSVSRSLSKIVSTYLEPLVIGVYNDVLEKATNIKHGKIIDQRINEFQNRK